MRSLDLPSPMPGRSHGVFGTQVRHPKPKGNVKIGLWDILLAEKYFKYPIFRISYFANQMTLNENRIS